jgi:tetratricopeptide (TPR) repeat protein
MRTSLYNRRGASNSTTTDHTNNEKQVNVTPIQTARKGHSKDTSLMEDDEDVPLSAGSGSRKTLIERMSFRASKHTSKHKSGGNDAATAATQSSPMLDSTNPLFAKAIALGLDLGMTDGTFKGMDFHVDPRLSIDITELVTSTPRTNEDEEEEEFMDDGDGGMVKRPKSVRRPTTFAAYLQNQKALQADQAELAAFDDEEENTRATPPTAATITTTANATINGDVATSPSAATPRNKTTHSSHSPWVGILLSHLKSLVVDDNVTVDQLATSLFAKNDQYATYAEKLLANPETRSLVKIPSADVAIFYPRDCLWSDLMDSLIIDDTLANAHDRYIWMDIFTHPQEPRNSDNNNTTTVPRPPRLASTSTAEMRSFANSAKLFAACELVLTPFWIPQLTTTDGNTKRKQHNIDGVVVVVVEENDEVEELILPSNVPPPPIEETASIPLSINRSWIHFQVFVTLKEKIPLILRASPRHIEQFLVAASNGIGRSYYMRLFRSAELKRSRSWYETDKTAVMGLLREGHAVGVELSNTVKRWLFQILDKAMDEKKNTKESAFLLNSRAHVCYANGDIDSAFQCYSKSADLIREYIGPSCQALGVVLSQQAEVLREKRRFQEALALYEEVLRISTAVHGAEHSECAIDLCNIAVVLQDLQRWQESKNHLDQALKIRKRVLGKHPLTADTLQAIGNLLHARGRSQKAIVYFNEAINIEREVLGPDSLRVGDSLHALGQILMAQRSWEDAMAKFKEAHGIRKEQLGEDDPETLNTYGLMGLIYLSCADFVNAKTILHFVLEKRKRVLGVDHVDVASSMSNFALLLHKTGDLDGARRTYEVSLSIKRKIFGNEHKEVAKTMSNLGFVLLEKGREEEAKQLGREALAIMEKTLGRDDPNTVMMMNWWSGD